MPSATFSSGGGAAPTTIVVKHLDNSTGSTDSYTIPTGKCALMTVMHQTYNSTPTQTGDTTIARVWTGTEDGNGSYHYFIRSSNDAVTSGNRVLVAQYPDMFIDAGTVVNLALSAGDARNRLTVIFSVFTKS